MSLGLHDARIGVLPENSEELLALYLDRGCCKMDTFSKTIEPKVGGNVVENTQASSCLLLEERGCLNVMPVYPRGESRNVF